MQNSISAGMRIVNAVALLCGFFQHAYTLTRAPVADWSDESDGGNPHLVSLRRETVPIYRYGKIASFKNSYSGIITIGGSRPQEFRVVFDTGSGQVVLPSSDCYSETCREHKRYDFMSSPTAVPVNMDGSPLRAGEIAEQVTIGYGTGEITGEFAKDTVCLGPSPAAKSAEANGTEEGGGPCVQVIIVMAIEMTAQPFKSFAFDGILGLGLGGLALSSNFSFFDIFSGLPDAGAPRFGFFLAEDDDDEGSEIAMGGYDPHRLLRPLAFSPVTMADLGYWMVEILAVRVDGRTLDVCRDGTCRGVVDTGTSHLGIPAPFDKGIAGMLATEAHDTLDCRLANTPTLEIELRGGNLTVHPETYMRRLPLREGVSVSAPSGVTMMSVNITITAGHNATSGNTSGAAAAASVDPPLPATTRFCRPKVMSVKLPAPLGPKLFILGEPVLHRYYSVFDWSVPQIGFGLAANRWNMADRSTILDRRGKLPDGVDSLLMQKKVHINVNELGMPVTENSIFTQMQMKITISVTAMVRSL